MHKHIGVSELGPYRLQCFNSYVEDPSNMSVNKLLTKQEIFDLSVAHQTGLDSVYD